VIAAVSTVIAAPVDTVWSLLDDFAGWHRWLPTIASTTMDDGLDQAPTGSVRILKRDDGSTIRERLVTKDDARRTMSYVFDGDHPYPVRRYVGTVRVEPVTTDNTTYVHWSGDFDCDAENEQATADTFRRVYRSFLQALSAAAAG
jgi:carbon monoxide dehydrogenase subunit G